MKLTSLKHVLVLLMASLLLSSPVTAQTKTCDPYWTGSWDTTYGQLRLIEDGDRVYGDYADLGTIKAYLNRPCGEYLRGTFERKDGRWGYIEFVATGDLGSRFSGRWTWENTTLPQWKGKIGTEWRGTVKDRFPPPILNFKQGETRDPLVKTPWQFHKWMTLVDIKAQDEQRKKQQEEQRARQEARRKAAEERKRKEAEAAKTPKPVKTGLAVNEGYASILSVGPTFDTNKANTAVSMQQHVQIVSSDGKQTAKMLLEDNDFTLIGDGVFEAGGINGERLRMTMVRKGPAIIVTFRGTGGDDRGETFANVIRSDARTKMVSPIFIKDSDAMRDVEKGVLVHKGFYDSYMRFRATIHKELKDEPKSNLFIFGHSLGGAMATLMAADMRTNYNHKFETITHMVSGSPRVGNAAFFQYFTRAVPDNLRIVLNNDPVPLIPNTGRIEKLTFSNYIHVGRLLVIEESGKPINGKDINIKLPLRFAKAFGDYHDNKKYLSAVRNMRDKQPTNPVLSPNANQWIYNTAKQERSRTK